MQARRILIANAKGGCGKSTIATNIASYYARKGLNVRLFDHDHQGSSLAWVRRRSEGLQTVHGVNACKNSEHRLTRSWQLRMPPETEIAVIDTPAGIEMTGLTQLLRVHDSIIIPVLPSPIDIHATAHFIKELLIMGKVRHRLIRLAVVANRVRKNTVMYRDLKRFLVSLNIPFISSLRDTQLYARAIDQGVSVTELSACRQDDKEQWAAIMHWLEIPFRTQRALDVSPDFQSKQPA